MKKLKFKEPVRRKAGEVLYVNGIRFRRMKGCLLLDQSIVNTIDEGFHSYSRRQKG